MLAKIIKWLGFRAYLQKLKHLMIKSQISTMSPIERHIYLNTVFDDTNIFHPQYLEWTMKRINKILELYGLDFFKNKRILELGGGIGDIGGFFAELGAEVLSLEGRLMNVVLAQLKNSRIKNYKCRQFNLENDFSEFGKFDLIINFGLVYHLKNVEKHLNCCAKMADNILLETVVCDSTDSSKIILVDDPEGNDEALDGTGSRPGPYYMVV